MAAKKKKKSLHHHAKRLIKVTPKFVHGLVAGAFIGAIVVELMRATFPAAALSAAVARDCSANSIIPCGALSAAEFIRDVQANKQGDLQDIYTRFGLPPSDYGTFLAHAKMGSDLRDGRVVVDGKTVATGAWSLGRQRIPGETGMTIDGRTYFRGDNQVSYGSGVQSIPVMVLFNSQGVMQFAVMTACSNPVGGTPVKPPKPPTPTPTPTPTPPPSIPTTPTTLSSANVTQLPNTGPGAVIIIAVLAVIGGYVSHMTHRHIRHKRRLAQHHRPAHAHAGR